MKKTYESKSITIEELDSAIEVERSEKIELIVFAVCLTGLIVLAGAVAWVLF